MKDVWDMNKQEWRDYLKKKHKAVIIQRLKDKGTGWSKESLEDALMIEADKRYETRDDK